MADIVAIVGRPNVGKSTFFNRLIGGRKAIVDEQSGVTRDRHYGKTTWNGREFTVIDTGGYISGSDDVFEAEIRKQVKIAINEASTIVFMVDVLSGITDLDNEVAKLLRKANKPTVVVANKVDNNARILDSYEFHAFGLGDVLCVSSINGSGSGEVLDAIVNSFPEEVEPEIVEDIPKIAIVGRPNAGKSSLVNSLLGEERNIVTNIAGTTRDTINTRYNSFGFEFDLVDTAGLRKKSANMDDLEFYSVMRAIKAIEESDVCLLMIDANEGVGAQDLNIFNLIEKNRKGIVILINKWDTIEKETNTMEHFKEEIKERIAPFTDVPILFISATEKQRIYKAVETAIEVYKNRTKKIKTSVLNEIMLPIIEETPPPATKGKFIKIKFITQLPTYAPTFAFFANLPQYIPTSYKRFIENRLRENFDFTGVPIQVFFRKK